MQAYMMDNMTYSPLIRGKHGCAFVLLCLVIIIICVITNQSSKKTVTTVSFMEKNILPMSKLVFI